MPSRLKVIETRRRKSFTTCAHALLWICLPVWRELKLFQKPCFLQGYSLWICLPVWRELKLDGVYVYVKAFSLWICLPVWRELKHLALNNSGLARFCSLDMPSRLKGIETRCAETHPYRLIALDMPSRLKVIETQVENRSFKFNPPQTLDMPSRLKGIETSLYSLGRILAYANFGYAFPFEGNWNTLQAFWRDIRKRGFGYAFPFEGNWNLIFIGIRDSCIGLLWICLPVWRELKPFFPVSGSTSSWLWICLPVWRELKHLR